MKAEEYEEQKEIRFFDKKSGKLIAYISQPNIKDANNELVYDSIHYEMESLKKYEYYFISAVVSIVVTKEAIDVVSAKRHKTKEYNPDPYGRKNQKKQGEKIKIRIEQKKTTNLKTIIRL